MFDKLRKLVGLGGARPQESAVRKLLRGKGKLNNWDAFKRELREASAKDVQEAMNRELTLVCCVGCGGSPHLLARSEKPAFPCRCGAHAAYLVSQWLHDSDSPLALLTDQTDLVESGRTVPLPHLEYYLGYSDHRDQVKTMAAATLRARGVIPQAECQQEGCQACREEETPGAGHAADPTPGK